MGHSISLLSLELVLDSLTVCAPPFLELGSVFSSSAFVKANQTMSPPWTSSKYTCALSARMSTIMAVHSVQVSVSDSQYKESLQHASVFMQGWMSFRCDGPDDLTSALSRSSSVQYFISQLPDNSIGKQNRLHASVTICMHVCYKQ